MKQSLFRSVGRWGIQPFRALRNVFVWNTYKPRIRRLVKKYRSAEFVGLQIGCGKHYKTGWINTDLPREAEKIDMPLDITRSMPFPDNYFSVIYGSEVIEHVSNEDAQLFLQEAHRILRDNGVLRLTTPDIEALCQIYLGCHPMVDLSLYERFWLGGEFSRDIYINAAFRWYGHQYLYSFEALSMMLKKAGFSDIKRVQAQQTASSFSQLQGIEQHYGSDAPAEIYSSAMILEAIKCL